jgi:hypothetical protein
MLLRHWPLGATSPKDRQAYDLGSPRRTLTVVVTRHDANEGNVQLLVGVLRGEDHVLIADLDLSRLAASHPRRLFIRDRRDELVPRLLGFDRSRTE